MRLPAVGLLQACDDPKLFGFDLWPRQRELLAAVEAGPLLHVWALGRRSGKTTMTALVALWDCLLRPELDRLVRPGERRHAVAVATNLRQARLIVRAALSIVERSPLLAELVESRTEDEVLFVNGSALSAFPCTSRGARGWPISTLVMDEAAAFLSETEGPQVAERVFEALVPSTAQFGPLARVIVSSTPYGIGNMFADLFQRATSGELEDAVAQHGSTAELNPTIDGRWLEQQRTRDPESFRQEYAAEFSGGGAAFLEPARIAAVVADRRELRPEDGLDWVAGLDPAFARDPFGVCIVGRDANDPGRLVLGVARRWRPSHEARSFDQRRDVQDRVLGEVADLCRHFGARAVTDQHLAPAVAEALRQAGLTVAIRPATAQGKTQTFQELRARVYDGSLELYEEPQLVAELRRLRTRYVAGRAAVENPRVAGSHGDMADALAIAVWELRGRVGGSAAGFVRVRDENPVERLSYDMEV